jgi:hypothetical protein
MNEFERLEDLLLGAERERTKAKVAALLEQQQRQQLEQLPQALPDIIKRAQTDERLSRALEKPIAQGLERIARTNKELLVSVFFPLIGPIIRKSIAESLSQLVRDLNRAMDHSLSPKGLRWRWESIRSGVPFAQVVLRHTLRYRIEHLLLVNNDGGLLLAHVPNVDAKLADSDAVAAMLSALQDFARDAVLAKPGEGLDSVSVGEMTLKIVRGPLMHLAVAYRGELTEELHSDLPALVETLHGDVSETNELEAKRDDFFAELQDWLIVNGQLLGDESPVAEKKAAFNAKPWLVAAAGIAVAYLMHSAFRYQQAAKINATLQGHAGIALQAQYQGGLWPARFALTGFRDDFAADPLQLIAGLKLRAAAIRPQWQPYVASDVSLWQARINASGVLPNTVQARQDGAKLQLFGSLSTQQYRLLVQQIQPLRSLVAVDFSKLEVPLLAEDAESYAARRALFATALPMPFDANSTAIKQWRVSLEKLIRRQTNRRLSLHLIASAAAKRESSAAITELQAWLAQQQLPVEVKVSYVANADAPVLRLSQINYIKGQHD